MIEFMYVVGNFISRAIKYADTVLRCCWLVYGKAHGLEFSIIRDRYTLHHSASRGIHVAGSAFYPVLS